MDLSKVHLHCRFSKYNGKTYKSYSLARTYRKDGKNCREILLKLGKLSDDEAEKWKIAINAARGKGAIVPLEQIYTKANYSYLDVAVLLEIWNSWGLNNIFSNDGEREIPLWMVVASLTISRAINPSSKTQVSTWFHKTALPFILGIDPQKMNPSRIFRELDVIEELKPALYDYLYKEIARRYPSSMNSEFYDLTSTTFSGNKCIIMKCGHCEEGYQNHIVLALLVNKLGLPIYWQVLPGSTADATTIEWLLGNVNDHLKIDSSTMVFDRRMVSEDNLDLLENSKIKFISAMDRNQLIAISDISISSFSGETAKIVEENIRKSSKFIKHNESTYYHEVVGEVDAQRRYILCFNPQLCEDQRNARLEGIEKFRQSLKAINKELLSAKNSREEKSTLNKFKKELSIEQKGFLEVVLSPKKIKYETEKNEIKTIKTYQGKLIVNEKKLRDAGELDGFWMIVTNHIEKKGDRFQMSASEAIQPYKDKVIIESAFRDIKSFLGIRPIYVWIIDHVKAHYTICVLAYLLNRTLTLKLHEETGDISEDIIAHTSLYSELEKCRLNHLKVKGSTHQTLGLTEPTAKQIEILERIDLKHLIQDDYVQSKCV